MLYVHGSRVAGEGSVVAAAGAPTSSASTAVAAAPTASTWFNRRLFNIASPCREQWLCLLAVDAAGLVGASVHDCVTNGATS